MLALACKSDRRVSAFTSLLSAYFLGGRINTSTLIITLGLIMADPSWVCAVPQQRPAMSEEAAAAIDADAARDKASGGKSQKKVTDSGKPSPDGYHNTDGKTVDGTNVADKVC